MAFVEIIVKVNGDSASDALEALADIGFAALQGVDAQAELAVQPDELSDVCNECQEAEDEGPQPPEDEYGYVEGAFYPVYLDENSVRVEVSQYAGDGEFLLAGVGEPIQAEFIHAIGDKLDF